MIHIRVTCDICKEQKTNTVNYDKLDSIRSLVDQYFTRIHNISLCNNCMTAYKTSKEEMELRHKEELEALLNDLLNP